MHRRVKVSQAMSKVNGLLLVMNWLEENSIVIDNQKAVADTLRMEGATVIYVATDGDLAGLIAISDPVKTTTPDALKALRQAGIRIVMLTGITSLLLKQSHGNWE